MPTAEPRGTDALRDRVAHEVERLRPRLRALALELHRDPELGCREWHAAGRMAGELEEDGFTVETGLAGFPTAFRAECGRGRPAIAFLAEYDAVPGLGHACGHNLVCAVAYGAAVALAPLLESTGGRLLVIGAPAEETIGGKVVLEAKGLFGDVDAALLAHPAHEDRARVTSLASWSMEVLFEGRAAHAVMAPEHGINALDAMIQLFVARDALLKRLRPEVLMPGVILEGGVRPNVVPDRARARFSLRAGEADYLVDVVLPAFRDLVEGVARATGTRARVRPVDNLYDEICSSEALARRYESYARGAGLDPLPGAGPPFGSLDVGRLSQRIPVLHPLFRIADEPLATHTEPFARAAASPRAIDAAVRVCRALALTGLDLLREPALLDEACAEHAGRGRSRETPLVTEPVEP